MNKQSHKLKRRVWPSDCWITGTSQLQFWGFLVAVGVLDEAEWWRLLVGHTHRKAGAVIAAFARAHKAQQNGTFALDETRHTNSYTEARSISSAPCHMFLTAKTPGQQPLSVL